MDSSTKEFFSFHLQARFEIEEGSKTLRGKAGKQEQEDIEEEKKVSSSPEGAVKCLINVGRGVVDGLR